MPVQSTYLTRTWISRFPVRIRCNVTCPSLSSTAAAGAAHSTMALALSIEAIDTVDPMGSP